MRKALIALCIGVVVVALPVGLFYLGVRGALQNGWYDLTYLADNGTSAALEFVSSRGTYRHYSIAEYRELLLADLGGDKNKTKRRDLLDCFEWIRTIHLGDERGRYGVFEQNGVYYWDEPTGGDVPHTAYRLRIIPDFQPIQEVAAIQVGLTPGGWKKDPASGTDDGFDGNEANAGD